jgi:hypothetical protein
MDREGGIESVFLYMKRMYGEHVSARKFPNMINEIFLKAAEILYSEESESGYILFNLKSSFVSLQAISSLLWVSHPFVCDLSTHAFVYHLNYQNALDTAYIYNNALSYYHYSWTNYYSLLHI